MPWWVAAYLSVYVTFSIWSLVDGRRSGVHGRWIAFEAVDDLCLILPTLVFWNSSLFSFLEESLRVIFVGGLVGMAVLCYRAIRENFSDTELSHRENIGLALVGSIVAISMASPLIWWGAQSSFLGRHAAI